MEAPRVSITADRRKSALRRVNRRGLSLRHAWDWAKSVAIAIVMFFVLRAFFVEAFKIPTGSMEQTLLVGDFLLVNKLAYGAEVPFTRRRLPALVAPQHGDIIVFRWPKDPRTHYIKRLVGLGGDTLAMRHGVLLRNGVPQVERYVTRSDPASDPADDEFRWQLTYLVSGADGSVGTHPSRNNWGPLVVPERSYFVLGDNRDNSSDSRYWGFVPDSLLGGRPIFVYYSYAPDSGKSLAWLTRIRWHRIGERID
jgi:signal peptidase I